jgi:hypothetical protein
MSDPQSLQFDRVEYASTPAATTCANCRQPIVQSYYEVNGKLICSRCHEALTQGSDGSRGLRVGRALIAGFGAAVVGAVVWWGVRKLTHLEVGLISIGIGIAVGKAVRWGSRQRGGWAYQLMAVLLTYSAVAGNYMPDAFQALTEMGKQETTTAASSTAPNPTVQKASAAPAKAEDVSLVKFLLALLVLFAIAAAAPFMGGFENIIGILIIGFGLYEAWKINKRVPLTITGPFSVAPAAPPASNV